MSRTGPKQAIYQSLAEVAQAIGHPHRLELLEHLAQGVRSVEELSAQARLAFFGIDDGTLTEATAPKHVRRAASSEVVEGSKDHGFLRGSLCLPRSDARIMLYSIDD